MLLSDGRPSARCRWNNLPPNLVKFTFGFDPFLISFVLKFPRMNLLFKIIISSLAVFLTAYILPGVQIDDYFTAVSVAIVLALLNGFLKPLLVLLTIPVTLFTLGFFLLVINAAIILLADYFVDGFDVQGFWWALLFSLVLSVITSVMESLGGKSDRKNGEKAV